MMAPSTSLFHFFVVLSFSFACCADIYTGPNRDRPPPISTALGFDIGIDKIIASFGFDNGTVRFLDEVPTTEEYKRLASVHLAAETSWHRLKLAEDSELASLFPQDTNPETIYQSPRGDYATEAGCPIHGSFKPDDARRAIESLQPGLEALRARAVSELGSELSGVPIEATSVLEGECTADYVKETLAATFWRAKLKFNFRERQVSNSQRVYQAQRSLFARAAIARYTDTSVAKYNPSRTNMALMIFYRVGILTLELLDVRGIAPQGMSLIKISYTHLDTTKSPATPDTRLSDDIRLQATVQSLIERFLRYHCHTDKTCELNDIDIVLEGDSHHATRDWLNLDNIVLNITDSWRGTIFDTVNPEHIRSFGAAISFWDVRDGGDWHKHLACRLVTTTGSTGLETKREKCYFPVDAHPEIDGCYLGGGPVAFFGAEDYHLGFEGLNTEPIPEFEEYRLSMEEYFLKNRFEDEAELRRRGLRSWHDNIDEAVDTPFED